MDDSASGQPRGRVQASTSQSTIARMMGEKRARASTRAGAGEVMLLQQLADNAAALPVKQGGAAAAAASPAKERGAAASAASPAKERGAAAAAASPAKERGAAAAGASPAKGRGVMDL